MCQQSILHVPAQIDFGVVLFMFLDFVKGIFDQKFSNMLVVMRNAYICLPLITTNCD
jgi:hypothetical protein